ncbi:MAG: hypothetical protein ACYCSO_04880 [Cuniculiplasma sp.]
MNSKKIILKKNITLNCYECLATVRRISKNRPDIEIAMELLRRFDNLSSEIIRKYLLPGKPEAMANNLFRRYQDLGFVDEFGIPKKFGEYAIAGNIYLPERGQYRLCSADDPMISQGIVSLMYHRDEKNHPKNSENGQSGIEQKHESLPIPPSVKAAICQRILVWSEKPDGVFIEEPKGRVTPSKEKLQINDIYIEKIEENLISLSEKHQIELEIEVNVSSTIIRFRTNDSKEPIQLNDDSKLDLSRLWSVLEQTDALETWKGGPLDQGSLNLRFEELTLPEILHFERTIPIQNLDILQLGRYSVLQFTVPIAPYSKTDAELWERSLLISNINDYQTRETIQALSDINKSKFSAFELEIPSAEDLIGILDKQKYLTETERMRKIWYLRAPLDLMEAD